MELSVIREQHLIQSAQNDLSNKLKAGKTKSGKIQVGFRGGHFPLTAYWFKKYHFWWSYFKITDAGIPRHWNAFGIRSNKEEPMWGEKHSHNITCEINFPLSKSTWQVGGKFVKNKSGKIYIAHSGKIGGGGKGIGKISFEKNFSGSDQWEYVSDGNNKRKAVIISALDDKNLISNLSYFVSEVLKIKNLAKEGKLKKTYRRVVGTQAYCVKCRKKVFMTNPVEVKLKDGRPAVRAHCHICGTNVFRIANPSHGRHKVTKPTKNKTIINTANIRSDISDDETVSRKAESKLSHIKDEHKSKKELDDEISNLDKETPQTEPKLKTRPKSKARVQRFQKIVEALKKRHDKCMICSKKHFEKEDGTLYSEVSHIIPFSVSHDDKSRNLMVLCPTCHKKFDNAKNTERRKMYKELIVNFPDKKFTKPMFI